MCTWFFVHCFVLDFTSISKIGCLSQKDRKVKSNLKDKSVLVLIDYIRVFRPLRWGVIFNIPEILLKFKNTYDTSVQS